MNSFLLKVSSPDGDLFSDKVMMLSLRGTEGSLAIMAGHVPFVTSVVPCECKIVLDNGDERLAECDGGLLTVSHDGASLLSGSFRWK